jgi:hypothetical protein
MVQPQAAERTSLQLRHQPERRPVTARGTGGAVHENGMVICFHTVFFAYRLPMDATSSRNAEPPRTIPDDGFKEISVSFHSDAVRGNRTMSEISEWRRSRKMEVCHG